MTFTHRPTVLSETGLVVSGHHRASEAGARMLRDGGNAMDGAVATAAALAVAVPHMNGLGGDAMALYYDAGTDEVTAINGSGRTPSAATVAYYRDLGYQTIPTRGPLSMSVPGVVRAWGDSLQRWGTKSLSQCFAPAIELAENGVPIDGAQLDFLNGPVYAELAAESPPLAEIFGAPGASRQLGIKFTQPQLAKTLQVLADEGAASFYEGAIADALHADLEAAGSLISKQDLAGHETEFGQPLSVSYRARSVYAAPPNSQGIALSLLLGLDEATKAQRETSAAPEPGLDVYSYMRAKHIAYEHRDRYAVDPARSQLPSDFLSSDSLARLASSEAASEAETRAGGGDTSTLVVVDATGNTVSWVQSLFEAFGSGIVSQQTGIILHNRLYLEQLNEDPSRGLRPGMRPFHTLCPAIVVGEQGCEMAIATPGDHGQPQALYQVLRHVFVGGVSIQDAIERPRLRHDQGEIVMVEDRASKEWSERLSEFGYTVNNVGPWSRLMGGVNAVHRLTDSVWAAGADPRRSCYAVSTGPL